MSSDERFMYVKLPRGVYIYLKNLFQKTIEQAGGRIDDEKIGDVEICTAIYGMIMEREERRKGGMEPAAAQIAWWHVNGEKKNE